MAILERWANCLSLATGAETCSSSEPFFAPSASRKATMIHLTGRKPVLSTGSWRHGASSSQPMQPFSSALITLQGRLRGSLRFAMESGAPSLPRSRSNSTQTIRALLLVIVSPSLTASCGVSLTVCARTIRRPASLSSRKNSQTTLSLTHTLQRLSKSLLRTPPHVLKWLIEFNTL